MSRLQSIEDYAEIKLEAPAGRGLRDSDVHGDGREEAKLFKS